MAVFAHPAIQRLRCAMLWVFPTCDLQKAIGIRKGVETRIIGPGEFASIQLNNDAPKRFRGPVTITINID